MAALRGLEANARRLLKSSGQEHLLDFLSDDPHERETYLKELLTIDYEEMRELFQRATENSGAQVQKLDDLMRPLAEDQIEAEVRADPGRLEEYRTRGLEEISKGHVGVILMAGGQGSRLGVSYPKGMYDVGLQSKKTLFQLQAERILKVQQLAAQRHGRHGAITWYIMTSAPTYDETLNFLKSNKYFGLNEKDVVIFKQGLLPCFNFDGKILLSRKNELALAPDGNGGIYKALEVNGVLDDFKKRGVLYLHCHSVDNILVKVADPVFVGYCVVKSADVGAKVVQKNSPTECVGVLCLVENKVQVVEYSEITEKTANLKNPDGELTFNAGNICNHFFSAEFLRRIAKLQMPLHVAKKKIPHVSNSGEFVKPTEPNGIKIEKFVFDVFAFADKFVAWEVPRESEFSALKNADSAGKDCPATAKQDLYRLHKNYLQRAGVEVVGDEVEIPPSVSYGGEGLDAWRGKTIVGPTLIKD